MTTLAGSEPVIAEPMTARVLLYGDEGLTQLKEQLSDIDILHDAGAEAGALGSVARKMLDDQLAPIADSFLDVDLGQVATAGWRLHEQLLAAARETRATPGLTSIVDLASHRIESTWHPRVEAVSGSHPVAHFTFELTVAFDITGLSAAVVAGQLTQIGGGRCRVQVSFRIGGRTLAQRSARFDPHLAFPLGAGIALPVVPEPTPAAEVITLPDNGEAQSPPPVPTDGLAPPPSPTQR